MTFEEIKALDHQYVMQSYGRFDVAVDHGRGATLWDTQGREYIDFTSGIGVCSLGYADEGWVNAITEQAGKLGHISNLFYAEPYVKAAEKLCRKAGMSNVFFANSGAESNEGLIKLARKYSFDKYGKGRGTIITLHKSFHGRTITTLSATGQDVFHNYFFPFTEGFRHADANDFDSVEAMAGHDVCAVMFELIQGEGGVLPLDREFVQKVADLCAKRDWLLLIDEVQTGIGRTGTLFCYEQYGIEPDIVSMAKGLGGGVPIGAILCGEKCADTLQPGQHGSTFGGNLLACRAAQTVLSVVDQPQFLASVKEKGEYIREQLLAMHSPAIREVRGMGLMLGIGVDPQKRSDYVRALQEKGVLVLTAGEDTIRLLPPLVITKEDIDQALACMKEVLK